MRSIYVFIILFFCFTTSFIRTTNTHPLSDKDDCQSILDSAIVFIQTSESAVNTKPTMKDNERNLRLDKWLQKLSFKDMTCLLESKNISLKVIGFIYASNFHSTSLLKKYSYLLDDTTTVQMFMANGKVSPEIKLGQLLSVMTEGIKESKENLAKEPQIRDTVSSFIKLYSTYPHSYKSISFPYFSMGSDPKGIRDFNIRHCYKIKNNKGKTVKVVNAFVLDKDLKINIIEKDSTRYSYAYPPKLDYWLKEFGRKLDKNDSVMLKLRN